MAGILSGPIDAPPEDKLAAVYPQVPATPGLSVVHRASGFSGVLVRIEGGGVEIRGRTGQVRVFRHTAGAFSVEGRAVSLVRPPAGPGAGPGGRSPADHRRRARWPSPTRRHGWHGPGGSWWRACTTPSWSSGCGGMTFGSKGSWSNGSTASTTWLPAIRAFSPGPARKLGVLVDHLVEGSKESRLADGLRHPQVLVTGTPFVDVWEAVKPSVVGIDGLAPHSQGDRLEERAYARHWGSASLRRPGVGSFPRSGATPIWNRPWWGRSSG